MLQHWQLQNGVQRSPIPLPSHSSHVTCSTAVSVGTSGSSHGITLSVKTTRANMVAKNFTLQI